MPKVSKPVNKNVLISAIKEAEKAGPLANRSELHVKVADLYNKNSAVKITHSIVMLRIKEWDLAVQTPMGRRGRAPGVALSPEQKAAMQAGRKTGGGVKALLRTPEAQAYIEKLYKQTPVRFHPLVDRVAKGSASAMRKLKCLECCCYQTAEIRLCTVICPQWLRRPYQNVNAAGQEVDEDDSEDTPEAA